MSFWGNFFKSFTRTAVQTLTSGGLESLAFVAKADIDKMKKVTTDEKKLMKKGVDLLVKRAKDQLSG